MSETKSAAQAAKGPPSHSAAQAPQAGSPQSIRSPVDHVLQLQRLAGNRAVDRLLDSYRQPAVEASAAPGQVTSAPAAAEARAPAAPAAQPQTTSPADLGRSSLRSWRASSDLWYFNGEPQGGPLPTQVTLQADAPPSGTFLWSVTEGGEKVRLSGGISSAGDSMRADDNRIALQSARGSSGADDVRVRVSHVADDGTPTGTYEGALGVRTPAAAVKVGEQTTRPGISAPAAEPVPAEEASGAEGAETEATGEQPEAEELPAAGAATPSSAPAVPKSLKYKGISHASDATWGYSTYITYEARDDKGKAIKGFDVNENWSTGVVNDYPKTNWPRGKPGGLTSTTTEFADHIGAVGAGGVPAPTAPGKKLGTTKIQHWGQEWYIGSTSPGKGTKVQTNTLQKYQDHATHESVKSPP